MRTRVKICGITRHKDAREAIAAGADALGLVFYPPSPRCITVEQAIEVVNGLPPFVTLVGLFVNAEAETIAEVVDKVGINLIQFHGNECPDYCAAHRLPWIKAIRMEEGVDVEKAAKKYRHAAALLLDSYRAGTPGGTGEAFDWARIPAGLAGRVILAGGLDEFNVGEAVRRVHPYAVDVSGGVERVKGIKDVDKMNNFIRGVRLAEQ